MKIKPLLLFLPVTIIFLLFFIPYKGHQTVGEAPKITYEDFSWSRFINKEFQKDYEEYRDKNFGFRNHFIRLKNELYNRINLGLFNSSFFQNIEKGKDGFLFQKNFIEVYFCNKNCEELLINNFKDLFKLKEKLEILGINFLFVIEPDKASVLNTKWPYKWDIQKKYNKNYSLWNFKILEECKQNNLNCLDLISYFENKEKKNFFVKGGEHWTMVGAGEAGEELLSKLDSSIKKSDLANKELKFSPFALHSEEDLILLLNTFNKKIDKKFPYYDYQTNRAFHMLKNKIFIYGDSYTDQLKDALLSTSLVKTNNLIQISSKNLNSENWLEDLSSTSTLIFSYTLPNILSTRLKNDTESLISALSNKFILGSGFQYMDNHLISLSNKNVIYILPDGNGKWCEIEMTISKIQKNINKIEVYNLTNDFQIVLNDLKTGDKIKFKMAIKPDAINKVEIKIPEMVSGFVFSEPDYRVRGLFVNSFNLRIN